MRGASTCAHHKGMIDKKKGRLSPPPGVADSSAS
jgi:hypothetical protein